MKRILGWFGGLSAKALLSRLEKRKRVEEQDLRKIYSLFVKDTAMRTNGALPIDEMRQVVKENVEDQLINISATLHRFLKERNDTVPFFDSKQEIPDKSDSLEKSTEEINTALKQRNSPLSFRPKISSAEVSQHFRERFGYSLRVAPSSIPHPDAGEGLWVDGNASPGRVVALFPGINYAPVHYREMLGYPRIDEDNPYLISRFDGVIIDSKPWGHGLHGENILRGTTQTFAELYEVEGRHPLALGHFTNHPGPEMEPNVLLASCDFHTSLLTRPYIPNVECRGAYAVIAEHEVVQTLVMVASRPLHNEEVLRNYRLNPSVTRPQWYSPVDEREDIMRWS